LLTGVPLKKTKKHPTRMIVGLLAFEQKMREFMRTLRNDAGSREVKREERKEKEERKKN